MMGHYQGRAALLDRTVGIGEQDLEDVTDLDDVQTSKPVIGAGIMDAVPFAEGAKGSSPSAAADLRVSTTRPVSMV
jgi:hypothetical protein